MEGLAFRYDRHEEITRYIYSDEGYALSSNDNARVLLPLKIFGWFCYFRCHTVQFNI